MDDNDLNSRLCLGWVRHRRYSPKNHTLKYPVFMLYLDVDELSVVSQQSALLSLEAFNWLSFRRQDFFAPHIPNLKDAVCQKIAQHSLVPIEKIDRVMLLTNLRTLGFVMNPVTFYYAFDKDRQLLAIMPEITNTPWKERDQYVLTTAEEGGDLQPVSKNSKSFRFKLPKKFHVSPFNPMNMQYDWRFSQPDRAQNIIHLENWQNKEKVFDATMRLTAQPLTASNIRKTLIRFPLMTVKIAVSIYINALKLWLKGAPFYPHPNKNHKEHKV